MAILTYNQKLILQLYNDFYGMQYPFFGVGHDEERTRTHINAQKMCFLLQLIDLDIGEFGYSWNYHGPFSPGLLAALRSLDAREEAAKEYYKSDSNIKELLLEEEIESIHLLMKKIALQDHSEDISKWMELLGSIAYLSNSVLPGEDFIKVNEELKRRKSMFEDDTINICAWDTLKKAGLLKYS